MNNAPTTAKGNEIVKKSRSTVYVLKYNVNTTLMRINMIPLIRGYFHEIIKMIINKNDGIK